MEGKHKLIRKKTLNKLEGNLIKEKLKYNKMYLTSFWLRNRKLREKINEKKKLLKNVVNQLKKKTTSAQRAKILRNIYKPRKRSSKTRKIYITDELIQK